MVAHCRLEPFETVLANTEIRKAVGYPIIVKIFNTLSSKKRTNETVFIFGSSLKSLSCSAIYANLLHCDSSALSYRQWLEKVEML